MTRIRTVLFDWGGVVADDPGDDFLHDLMLSVGATEMQIVEIFRDYLHPFMRGKITEKEFWNLVAQKYTIHIPDSTSDEFLKWRGMQANNHILTFVDTLRANGYGVGLFTNVIEPSYNVLKKSGFYDHFDQIIASCNEGYGKPDKEIYDIALKKMKANPRTTLFIDDKERNLIPARNLGIKTILAIHSEQIISDTKQLLGNL